MAKVSSREWQEFISSCVDPHILQSQHWGELKSCFGWTPTWFIEGALGAQVLLQSLPLGFKVAYIPRGPVSSSGSVVNHPDWSALQEELDKYCLAERAVFLKIEPDFWEEDLNGGVSPFPGFKRSAHSIQPSRTLVVGLEETEEQILARMKSKTRYNIRLADKKGVTVREIATLDPFYDLLLGTSDRADFGIHTKEYYQKTFELFHPSGACAIFLAEYEGIPLASIMVFHLGSRSWYFYGASSNQHRDLMPTYLIQWEAMRWAKERGSMTYDLWGVPDEDSDTLEEEFTTRSDGLWGVYRFKRGFGGQLLRASGPWDRVYNPSLYALYKIRARIQGGEQ